MGSSGSSGRKRARCSSRARSTSRSRRSRRPRSAAPASASGIRSALPDSSRAITRSRVSSQTLRPRGQERVQRRAREQRAVEREHLVAVADHAAPADDAVGQVVEPEARHVWRPRTRPAAASRSVCSSVADLDRQLDVDLQRRAVAAGHGDLAEAVEERQHRVVGRQQRGGEDPDAVLGGARAQPPQQLAAEPAVLPGVDHGHGGLGDVRALVLAHVARHAHALAGGRVQRPDRLVVDVVDLGEERQLVHREPVAGRQEALVDRLVGEVRPARDEQRLVLRADGPHEHLGAVAQRHVLARVVPRQPALIGRRGRLGLLLGVVARERRGFAAQADEVPAGGARLDVAAHVRESRAAVGDPAQRSGRLDTDTPTARPSRWFAHARRHPGSIGGCSCGSRRARAARAPPPRPGRPDARRHAAERLRRRPGRDPGAPRRRPRRSVLRPRRGPRPRRHRDQGRRHRLSAAGRLLDRARPRQRRAADDHRQRRRHPHAAHRVHGRPEPARERGPHVHRRHLADRRPLRDHEHLRRADLDPRRCARRPLRGHQRQRQRRHRADVRRASSAGATRPAGSSTASRRSRRGAPSRRATSSSSSTTSRGNGLNNTVDSAAPDNGVGATWQLDNLAPGETRAIDVRWLLAAPAPPGTVSPPAARQRAPTPRRHPRRQRRRAAAARSRASRSTSSLRKGKVCFTPPKTKKCIPLDGPGADPGRQPDRHHQGRDQPDLGRRRRAARCRTRGSTRGIFKVGQTKGSEPITELTLAGPEAELPEGQEGVRVGRRSRRPASCGATARASSAPRASSARRPCAARSWVVIDRCDGTLTQVKRGLRPRPRHQEAQERDRPCRQAVPRAQEVSWVSVLAGFLVAHMVGDYLFQTDWQARNKRGGLSGGGVARARAAHPRDDLHAGVRAGVHLDRLRARRGLGDRRRRARLRPAPDHRRRPRWSRSTSRASSGVEGLNLGARGVGRPVVPRALAVPRRAGGRGGMSRRPPRAPVVLLAVAVCRGGRSRGAVRRPRGCVQRARAEHGRRALHAARRAGAAERRRHRRRRRQDARMPPDERLPLDRARHAKVIEQLTKAGAAVIAYDFQFTERERRRGRRQRARSRRCAAAPRDRARDRRRRTRTARPTIFGGGEGLEVQRGDARRHALRSPTTSGEDDEGDRVRRHAVRALEARQLPDRGRELGARHAVADAGRQATRWIDFPGPPGTFPVHQLRRRRAGDFDAAAVRGQDRRRRRDRAARPTTCSRPRPAAPG